MLAVRPLLRSSAARSSRPRLAALRLAAPHRAAPLLSRRVFFVRASFPFYGTDFSSVPSALPRARFLASTRLRVHRHRTCSNYFERTNRPTDRPNTKRPNRDGDIFLRSDSFPFPAIPFHSLSTRRFIALIRITPRRTIAVGRATIENFVARDPLRPSPFADRVAWSRINLDRRPRRLPRKERETRSRA